MPTLEWIGKDKVVNHHMDVPYRVLEQRYTCGAETSENRIIRGDNLAARLCAAAGDNAGAGDRLGAAFALRGRAG